MVVTVQSEDLIRWPLWVRMVLRRVFRLEVRIVLA
jgi:hypothetical protein